MARTLTAEWLESQLDGAPGELTARMREFFPPGVAAPSAAELARAGRRALAAAVAGSPDRRAALDLLAADALVTLALAAQVESEPEGLERFAAALRAESEPFE